MTFTLTWYGHASMRMDVDGYKLLVDPYFGDNPVSSITADKAEADFILVSHGHGDHTGDALEIAKRTGATLISNFEIATWYEEKGIKNVHAQHIGGGFKYPFGYLKLTMALHGSAMPDGSYGGNPAGFLLTTNDGKKIYLACDTGLFGDMRLIGEEGIDLAVLPIGDNFTMGPQDALRAVKFIQPKHVIPVHFDTWELIVQDPEKWAEAVRRETNTQVHVLKPGQTFSLD
jgi:L-ascorbate metabolism protein UlaG (beta-lactamase superfamily)